ncbi:aldehyde dehydrogenase family protein [Endozoicomonas arenosclerae]|uniref:aldehyde dehydrogenase family protein n=1 Tax=Endozoicomonas arenosclerae TaxID=1633495 RepID=UPI0007865727|nr:aldehyde dehydrogenase family protein [Endozoicomonas arenosclerae]
MKQHNQFYINGQWVEANSPDWIDVVNPATEAVIAQVAKGTKEDVDSAVKAARDAFISWSETPSEERARLIGLLAQKMSESIPEMARIISSEQGMPVHLCELIQAGGPALAMSMHADMVALMDQVETRGSVEIYKEAIGVCAFITPWNYPLHQIIGKVAPALAAGCTMVLKPSVETPLNALKFTELLDEVGFPPGVFNLVNGSGSVVGEALSSHPEVDMVSFTGSTGAGTRVSAVAAQTVKRVTLELGGKSAFIITDDAPLADAVGTGVQNVMSNCGQTCTALTRMLVPQSRYEEAVEIAKATAEQLTVGDPQNSENFMGPLVSKAQWNDVTGYIQKGIEEGARLVTGGKKPDGLTTGYYLEPTIFADVNNQMTIAQEEIFGPVLVMIPYQDIDEAITIANDSPYGLSGGVWAKNADAARAIARKIRTGMVNINGGSFSYEAPFGGYKMSGNGREWGKEGVEEFVELKSMMLSAH